MGSKASRLVRRPHANADRATNAATTHTATPQPHNNEHEDCQAPRLPDVKYLAPLVVDFPAPSAASVSDAPAAPVINAEAMDTTAQPAYPQDPLHSHMTDFAAGEVNQEHDTTNTDIVLVTPQAPPTPPVEASAPPPTTMPSPPPPLPPAPAQEPEVACMICCEKFPQSQKDATVRPCKPCGGVYCTTCLRDMFTKACSDLTRMPPRCCTQIQIHHVRPYLTPDEAALFREKYEEWSTPNPFYCPVPSCSAFIPNRVLQQSRDSKKGKARVDSVVGTPTTPNISCLKCKTDVCTNCRQLAHTGSVCEQLAFGVDEETAELLKSWGYKKCPKCGQGVRRMFGCNHMECYCGAHWCWVCQRAKDDCDEDCYDDGGEYDSEEDRDDDDEDEDEAETEPAQPEGASAADAPGDAAADNETPLNVDAATSTDPPVSSPRRRNLDGGSHRYWEELDLDFGNEPTDDIQDRAWACGHIFYTAKVSFEESFNNPPGGTGMECSRCWNTIHPEIDLPHRINKGGRRMVTASARGGTHIPNSRGRARLRTGRPRFTTPREMHRRDSSSGAASTISFSGMSQIASIDPDPLDPMEDIRYSNNGDRIVDTYGNVVSTTDWIIQPQRRQSLDLTSHTHHHHHDSPHFLVHPQAKKSTNSLDSTVDNLPALASTKIDPLAPTSPFSFAHECDFCGILLCGSCKTEALEEVQARNATY